MLSTERLKDLLQEAGMIYDPHIVATIINYEAGYIVRNSFYAALTGPGELQLRAGYLANLQVELSDLITQARILASAYNWDWSELTTIGEAKLLERIDDYKARGIRPWDQLRQKWLSVASRPQPRPREGD